MKRIFIASFTFTLPSLWLSNYIYIGTATVDAAGELGNSWRITAVVTVPQSTTR